MESPSLRQQLGHLKQIQAYDHQIEHLQKSLAEIPASLRELQQDLNILKDSLEISHASVRSLHQEYEKVTSALKLQAERVDRVKARLTMVTNAQEYQAVLKEQDQLTKLHQTLKEQELAIGNQLLTVEGDIGTYQEIWSSKKKTYDHGVEEFLKASNAIKATVKELTAEKHQLHRHITSTLLRHYEKIRNAKSGLGVVEVHKGQCGGCHMTISAQILNEVIKAEHIQACPYCKRILCHEVAVSATT